jgi:hypothetical protein
MLKLNLPSKKRTAFWIFLALLGLFTSCLDLMGNLTRDFGFLKISIASLSFLSNLTLHKKASSIRLNSQLTIGPDQQQWPVL